MIDVNKLRGRMAEKRVSGSELAGRMGVANQTFYRKMNQGVFDSNEIEVIMDALDIEDPREIFFAKEVAH